MRFVRSAAVEERDWIDGVGPLKMAWIGAMKGLDGLSPGGSKREVMVDLVWL